MEVLKVLLTADYFLPTEVEISTAFVWFERICEENLFLLTFLFFVAGREPNPEFKSNFFPGDLGNEIVTIFSTIFTVEFFLILLSMFADMRLIFDPFCRRGLIKQNRFSHKI